VLLSRKQIEELVGKTVLSHDGKNLYGRCPFCGGNEWGISLEGNNAFNCFRKKHCGQVGNAYTLLSFFKKKITFDRILSEVLSTFEDEVEKEIGTLPLVTPPVGWKRNLDDEYLRSRGWLDYQFEKYQVGRSFLKKDYVTVLVEMNNQTVAYLGRSIKRKEEIDKINEKKKITGEKKYLRYDNSVGSDFGKMLFGYDDLIKGKTKDVILVEGWLSKTKTEVNLELDFDPTDVLKCAATFGAKVSDDQIKLLLGKGVENIYLWFEGDVLDKVKPIAMKLSNYFNVKTGYIGDGRDPNDWDREECISFFDKCVSPLELATNYL
jgi:hypothetical protein